MAKIWHTGFERGSPDPEKDHDKPIDPPVTFEFTIFAEEHEARERGLPYSLREGFFGGANGQLIDRSVFVLDHAVFDSATPMNFGQAVWQLNSQFEQLANTIGVTVGEAFKSLGHLVVNVAGDMKDFEKSLDALRCVGVDLFKISRKESYDRRYRRRGERMARDRKRGKR